ncbi:MAG: Do family serine endopeptidase [Verrucomicrobia bacterium]|nr:Do family serine endopeptidase [Verrucomicrobiota bacterium]
MPVPAFRLLAVVLLAAASAVAAEPKARSAPAVRPAPPAVRLDASPLEAGLEPARLRSYADVIEPAQKAVVSVYSTRIVKERMAINPLFRQYFGDLPERESRQEGLGSGVIVSPDGYILTNNHVIEGADELKVTLADDRDFPARVVGTDPKTDVAVLKIEAEGLPVLTVADSDRVRVGDIAFAVGNPLGVGQTVTMGIVSAKGRSRLGLLERVSGYEDFIQTDAAINMGNSGGALIDARGRLIGVNSAIISPSRGNIGIGFAIPVNLARFIMNSLVETGTVARGYLGVTSDTLTAELAEQLGLARGTRGVIITEIDAASPAEATGLRRADVIVALNGQNVLSWEELRVLVAQCLPDSKVSLKVLRDGKARTVEVELGRVIDNPDELVAGVEAAPLTPEVRRRLGLNDSRIAGLVVTRVSEDSPHRGRLAEGMVILEINRAPVPDLAAGRERIRSGRNLLAVFDGRGIRYLVITVK